ncbi:YacL family protein [Paraferrimonas haliotis]|uniref:UPF0231 protein YacL n=1 Tax=Paraferrimonas haliotis TaxID=2013866 RepID=A0AA37WWD3_9GAMM|nr:YacL family protein [Paraferrimonas haliotis]GLS83342.1 UPF0231 protein YacL [Paraferrimonas haliotis]
MDYQFRQDPIDGRVMTQLSMEQQVLGHWFNDELALNASLQQQLLRIDDLSALSDWQYIGREISIQIDDGDVFVWVNGTVGEDSEEYDAGLSLYTEESQTQLGVEDFIKVLNAWFAFKNGY